MEKECGETEPKIPKTECSEEDQNGSALPPCLREDWDGREATSNEESEEPVPLVVIFNKKKHDVKLALSAKMAALRQEIQRLTGVPPAMQKLMYKGELLISLHFSGSTMGLFFMLETYSEAGKYIFKCTDLKLCLRNAQN